MRWEYPKNSILLIGKDRMYFGVIEVNPDISQEFGFGRPFCPAAAFSVKKVLSVFSNMPPGLFGLRPCIGTKFLVQNSPQSCRGVIYFVRPRRSYSYDDSVKTL
jgi:hypothetical protein